MTGSKILSLLNVEMSTKKLPLLIRENFFEVRNDRTLKLKFSEVQLDMFWISIKEEYKQISKAAIKIFLQFCTTYMCEQSFSSLLQTENDKRSCIKNVDNELRVALSSIEPNIERLCSLKQAQISQLMYEHKSYRFFAFLVFLVTFFVAMCRRI